MMVMWMLGLSLLLVLLHPLLPLPQYPLKTPAPTSSVAAPRSSLAAAGRMKGPARERNGRCGSGVLGYPPCLFNKKLLILIYYGPPDMIQSVDLTSRLASMSMTFPPAVTIVSMTVWLQLP